MNQGKYYHSIEKQAVLVKYINNFMDYHNTFPREAKFLISKPMRMESIDFKTILIFNKYVNGQDNRTVKFKSPNFKWSCEV